MIMRFPEQKKDAFSITFYIVLSFVLFSIFVTIPFMLWIYGYNIDKTEFLKQDFICTIKIYCGVALFVAIVFLWFSYCVIKRTYLNNDTLKKTINNHINNKIMQEATQKMIKDGLNNLFSQQLTESAKKTIEEHLTQEKDRATKSIESMKTDIINDMNKTKDDAQRILDEIRLLQQQMQQQQTASPTHQ